MELVSSRDNASYYHRAETKLSFRRAVPRVTNLSLSLFSSFSPLSHYLPLFFSFVSPEKRMSVAGNIRSIFRDHLKQCSASLEKILNVTIQIYRYFYIR